MPHPMVRTFCTATALATILVSVAAANTVTITSSKDNTIFSEAVSNSDGANIGFYAGNTNTGATRRGLIAFTLTGNVPTSATINSVSLQLNCSKTAAGAQTVSLYRLNANWGEGTSDSGATNGGGGAAATTNDATWVARFFPSTNWTTPGGDFQASASASASVSGVGLYTWNSTAQLVADVQGWLNNPATNFGWIVRSNESATQTTKRFSSKEDTASLRPALTITFTPVTAVQDWELY